LRRLGVAGLIALLLSGCVSSKKTVAERTLTADEVLRRVQERDEKISTLSGTGKITIESPESSGSGSFTADVKKPDSALVELTGPFGIRIGTLALARQELVYYDWRTNTATVGNADEKTLRAVLRIDLRFDEILHAFTGEFLSFTSDDSLESFRVDQGLYVLLYRRGNLVRELRIDGDSFIVTSYRLLDAEGNASLVALASRPDEVGGITMPTLLRVIMPKERRSLTVAYGDLRINEEVHCSFAIPREAGIIRR
jgi:outer membrane lipoprotein-sorting protein